MKRLMMVLCLGVVGCQSLHDKAVDQLPAGSMPCDPTYYYCKDEPIVVELPLDELQKRCGLWSGKSGCVWMNHKFVLKQNSDV